MVGLLLVAALAYPAVELSSVPGFCRSCHEIGPAYQSWQQSAHHLDGKTKQIRAYCRDCHVPSWKEPWAVIGVKLSHGFGDLYHHLAGNARPSDPEFYFALKQKTLGDVPDKVCVGCHRGIYEKDVINTEDSGEVRGLHASAETKKVRCTVCHKNTGHGLYD